MPDRPDDIVHPLLVTFDVVRHSKINVTGIRNNDCDHGFTADIEFTPIPEDLMRREIVRISTEMERAFARVVLEFYVENGRWPLFAWFDHPSFDVKPIYVVQFDVGCGDVTPEDVRKIYRTGILNHDKNLATRFHADAVAKIETPH